MSATERRRRPIVPPGCVAGAIALAWAIAGVRPIAAQSRETMETKITVEGSTVVLEWSKKHPWDAELTARGAVLVAEYRTERGLGVDCLQDMAAPEPAVRGGAFVRRAAGSRGCPGVGSRPGDRRELRFRLPSTLTAVPTGPVCLALRVSGDRTLPIRRATDRGDNTAFFRHQAWEAEAARRARVDALVARNERLERGIAELRRGLATLTQNNERHRFTSAASCEAATVSVREIAATSRPVAEPRDQDQIARRVCIMRVVAAESLVDAQLAKLRAMPAAERPPVNDDRISVALYLRNVQAPTLLRTLLDRAGADPEPGWLPLRQPQLDQLSRDWETWAVLVPEYQRRFPRPHFESFSPTLDLQTEAGAAGRRVTASWKAGKPAEMRDIRAVVGGSVEAYDRCVVDGRHQLALNYENARSVTQTTSTLRERVRLEAVRECRAALSRADALGTRIAGYEAERDANLREIRDGTAGALPAKSHTLNGATCTP